MSIGLSQGAITAIIVCAIVVVGLIIYAIIRGQRRKLTAGVEEMIGKIAVAQTNINPKGTVLAEGELWTAITTDEKIELGEEAVITRVEGLKLWVTKISEEKEGK